MHKDILLPYSVDSETDLVSTNVQYCEKKVTRDYIIMDPTGVMSRQYPQVLVNGSERRILTYTTFKIHNSEGSTAGPI